MTDTKVNPRAVDIPTAAAMYGVKDYTIRAAIHAGKLRAKRPSKDSKDRPAGKYLIRVADLDTWFDALEDA